MVKKSLFLVGCFCVVFSHAMHHVRTVIGFATGISLPILQIHKEFKKPVSTQQMPVVK